MLYRLACESNTPRYAPGLHCGIAFANVQQPGHQRRRPASVKLQGCSTNLSVAQMRHYMNLTLLDALQEADAAAQDLFAYVRETNRGLAAAECELLYGRAGMLYALLFVEHTCPHILVPTDLVQVSLAACPATSGSPLNPCCCHAYKAKLPNVSYKKPAFSLSAGACCMAGGRCVALQVMSQSFLVIVRRS
jgi:hypothetical protein